MELSPRNLAIISYLKEHSEVQIEHLATLFEVTTQTIRRDVNLLCEQGLARRIHGGLSLPANLTNSSYQFRREIECDAKMAIAQAVARQIPVGSTVMMGIGTSMAYVAHFLAGFTELRVITNNLQVAKTLENSPNIEVYLSGGLVRCDHQDVVGQTTLKFFADFEADIGLVGCSSVTSNHTAMEHEPQEAEISKAIITNARQNWLLADASKWERFGSVKVANLSEFSRIFTNKTGLPNELPVSTVS
ncbi:DeoR/GlpR family DNA-binding transcription regulator [Reinekea sp.]|jgi:DeoR family glycerol-3-phosphate regulon repressor|uniref:DeoR/GlpR family DNA-binding transcription regulator n=1 Tax=Reinekea sp. TaxID=1970455 RepID=UPI00398A4EBC